MFELYTVALFGHRYIADPFHLEARLEELVHHILSEQPYVDFLVGENGDFDRYACRSFIVCAKSSRKASSTTL